jgi:Cu-processing system ATP-binding protein
MIGYHEVTKRFAGRAAVDLMTAQIHRGDVTALLGPNGSGKTTSLKMAAGLIRPDAGTITIGEPPLAAWMASARAALSYLPQRVAFPEALTGGEVVDFYRQLRGLPVERGAHALTFAGLNGAGSRAVATYSGGMVQRLGLAVAVMPEADALLLDEPTAALDPEGLAAFYSLIEKRRRDGSTVFFTSHQVADVERLADRVLVLVKGRLVADFTRAELRRWLDENGVMRIRVARSDEAIDAIRRAGLTASLEDSEIVIKGPARARAAVLEAVRAAGGTIQGLTAESGRLDALYMELVDGASPGDVSQ